MVTDEADSADALHQHRRLPERVALNEFLESAELDDMQPGVDDVAVVVEVHGHLAVALDAGDGVDDQAFCSREASGISRNDSASGAARPGGRVSDRRAPRRWRPRPVGNRG